MSVYDREAFSERVAYAAQCILRGRTHGRAFDTCFEMFDDDYVVAMLMRRARKNPELATALHNGFLTSAGLVDWEQTAARFDYLSDRELRAAAKTYRDAKHAQVFGDRESENAETA